MPKKKLTRQDLREAADTYGLGGWTRWRTLYLPAVFPHLVTGLITAAGGAFELGAAGSVAGDDVDATAQPDVHAGQEARSERSTYCRMPPWR